MALRGPFSAFFVRQGIRLPCVTAADTLALPDADQDAKRDGRNARFDEAVVNSLSVSAWKLRHAWQIQGTSGHR